MTDVLLLFAHTKQGNHALADLLKAGVPHTALRVIGDLGGPAGEAGAEQHVTLDTLHVPAELRGLVMDTVRDGGVLLGADTGVVSADEVERSGRETRRVAGDEDVGRSAEWLAQRRGIGQGRGWLGTIAERHASEAGKHYPKDRGLVPWRTKLFRLRSIMSSPTGSSRCLRSWTGVGRSM